MAFSNTTKTVVGLALIVGLLAGLAAIGAAATAEMANETVTFDAEENVTVDVTWNDSISDVANASATVTFYNATEFEDQGTNASVVLEDTIAAVEGNTTTTTYTGDSYPLEDGTDYQVVVEADDTEVDSVTVDDGNVGGLFFGADGTPGFGAGVAIAAAAVAVAGLLARRGS